MNRKYNPIYLAWKNMRQRCFNPNRPDYKYYGGRGIMIIPDWNTFDTFSLWAMNHGWQKGLTLDRIDNNQGYSPENCRWVSRKVQSNNQRHTRIFTYNNRPYTLSELIEEIGVVKRKVASTRIQRLGWDVIQAVITPAFPLGYRRKTMGVL